MTDEQLACLNNAEALAELVTRYTRTVLKLAAKYSGSADYEELVGVGMDTLLTAAAKYCPERGGFAAFASVCISNGMKNLVIKADRRNRHFSELADEEIPDSRPTPEEQVIIRENTEEIFQRIKTLLTPLEQQCIEGVILGMKYREIAAMLSIDVKKVDNAVTRARAKLRKNYPKA